MVYEKKNDDQKLKVWLRHEKSHKSIHMPVSGTLYNSTIDKINEIPTIETYFREITLSIFMIRAIKQNS